MNFNKEYNANENKIKMVTKLLDKCNAQYIDIIDMNDDYDNEFRIILINHIVDEGSIANKTIVGLLDINHMYFNPNSYVTGIIALFGVVIYDALVDRGYEWLF